MVQQELSKPVTVQMRLPAEILERMQRESERDMIPLSYLVRKCLLRFYGEESFVSDDRTKSTEAAQIVHTDEGQDK